MENLDKALAELCSKLGVSVEYLWPRLIEFVKVRSIAEIVACCLGLVIATGVIALFCWRWDKWRDDYDVPMVVGGVMATSASVMLSIQIMCSAINYMCPEVSAIRFLGELIK